MPATATSAMSVPLWRQLQATAEVVAAVRQGGSATDALARIAPDLRGAAQALSFQALRQLGRAQVIARLLAGRAPPPQADALLCTALALAWREGASTYPPYTLVHQAVEACKRHPLIKAQAGFLNACLRRFLREREELVDRSSSQPLARWNHPDWWVARLRRDWPQQWQTILESAQSPAPLTLRVQSSRTSVTQVLDAFSDAGVVAYSVGPAGIVLDKPQPITSLPGFSEGWWAVQDLGAQLAAPMLLDGWSGTAPLRVLDACAAPGGKTAHLLDLAPCDLTALDRDPVRCERIRQNLSRLGQRARVVAADAADVASWWDGQPFDAILLDAPCSASGIVRRHPDVRWLRRESDISQLAEQQMRLLRGLWPVLKPGGHLLFCTCSVFRDEGERPVQTFLEHNRQARLRPSPGHLLPASCANAGGLRDNGAGEHDGFFYALLEKSSAI